MRSMSLLKRTPDVPRCGSELPNALCIFQRTVSCAPAGVASTAMDMADANVTQNFKTGLDIFPLLPRWKKDHRDLCDIRQAASPSWHRAPPPAAKCCNAVI
jgi:hypothetical protein